MSPRQVKKLPRIRLDRIYCEINKALCTDESVKFANEPVLDKFFERIRTEVNKIDRNDGIFVAFTKIKVLTNEKLHLKLS